jgi:hypothetical protein
MHVFQEGHFTQDGVIEEYVKQINPKTSICVSSIDVMAGKHEF